VSGCIRCGKTKRFVREKKQTLVRNVAREVIKKDKTGRLCAYFACYALGKNDNSKEDLIAMTYLGHVVKDRENFTDSEEPAAGEPTL
jgi:hypothetical protein